MNSKCDLCGKEFKNTQGLRGHKTFVHKLTKSAVLQQLDGKKDIPEPQPAAKSDDNPVTSKLSSGSDFRGELLQQVSKLQTEIKTLESMHKNDYSSILESVRNIEKSYAQKCDNLGNVFTQYSEQLDELQRGLEELQNNTDNRITRLVNDTSKISHDFSNSERGWQDSVSVLSTKFKTMSETLHNIERYVQLTNTEVKDFKGKIDTLEQSYVNLESGIRYTKLLATRVPTGEVVSVALNDGRNHKFREYRSSEGLTKPYQTKSDLILGGKWVDLNEPLN